MLRTLFCAGLVCVEAQTVTRATEALLLMDATEMPSAIPDTCSQSLMGQAVAYACPDLFQYVFNTNSFVQNGPEGAINYLSLSSDSALTVGSLSQETTYPDALMLLKSGFQVVRASQATSKSFDLSITPLYTLNSEYAPSAINSLWQFDTFTLVHFDEGSFFVAFPPKEPSQVAVYGQPVRYGSTDYVLRINSTETPVMASTATIINSEPTLFVVTARNDATQVLSKYSIVTDEAKQVCKISLVKAVTVSGLTFQTNQTDQIVVNDHVLAVGCDLCNNGLGLISVYDTATLTSIGTVQGREPTLQTDQNLDLTTYLWYISSLNTIEAAQIYYDSTSKVMETSFAMSDPSLPTALFNLNLWKQQLFYTGSDLKVSMVTSCNAGETPSSSGVCEPCQVGYYSLGVQSTCLECGITAELMAASTRTSAVIDQICVESNAILEAVTDTIREVSEATGLDMTTILVLSIVLPVLFVGFPIILACFSGIFLLLLTPLICLVYKLYHGKRKQQNQVKSLIEKETTESTIVHQQESSREVTGALDAETLDNLPVDDPITIKEYRTHQAVKVRRGLMLSDDESEPKEHSCETAEEIRELQEIRKMHGSPGLDDEELQLATTKKIVFEQENLRRKIANGFRSLTASSQQRRQAASPSNQSRIIDQYESVPSVQPSAIAASNYGSLRAPTDVKQVAEREMDIQAVITQVENLRWYLQHQNKPSPASPLEVSYKHTETVSEPEQSPKNVQQASLERIVAKNYDSRQLQEATQHIEEQNRAPSVSPKSQQSSNNSPPQATEVQQEQDMQAVVAQIENMKRYFEANYQRTTAAEEISPIVPQTSVSRNELKVVHQQTTKRPSLIAESSGAPIQNCTDDSMHASPEELEQTPKKLDESLSIAGKQPLPPQNLIVGFAATHQHPVHSQDVNVQETTASEKQLWKPKSLTKQISKQYAVTTVEEPGFSQKEPGLVIIQKETPIASEAKNSRMRSGGKQFFDVQGGQPESPSEQLPVTPIKTSTESPEFQEVRVIEELITRDIQRLVESQKAYIASRASEELKSLDNQIQRDLALKDIENQIREDLKVHAPQYESQEQSPLDTRQNTKVQPALIAQSTSPVKPFISVPNKLQKLVGAKPSFTPMLQTPSSYHTKQVMQIVSEPDDLPEPYEQQFSFENTSKDIVASQQKLIYSVDKSPQNNKVLKNQLEVQTESGEIQAQPRPLTSFVEEIATHDDEYKIMAKPVEANRMVSPAEQQSVSNELIPHIEDSKPQTQEPSLIKNVSGVYEDAALYSDDIPKKNPPKPKKSKKGKPMQESKAVQAKRQTPVKSDPKSAKIVDSAVVRPCNGTVSEYTIEADTIEKDIPVNQAVVLPCLSQISSWDVQTNESVDIPLDTASFQPQYSQTSQYYRQAALDINVEMPGADANRKKARRSKGPKVNQGVQAEETAILQSSLGSYDLASVQEEQIIDQVAVPAQHDIVTQNSRHQETSQIQVLDQAPAFQEAISQQQSMETMTSIELSCESATQSVKQMTYIEKSLNEPDPSVKESPQHKEPIKDKVVVQACQSQESSRVAEDNETVVVQATIQPCLSIVSAMWLQETNTEVDVPLDKVTVPPCLSQVSHNYSKMTAKSHLQSSVRSNLPSLKLSGASVTNQTSIALDRSQLSGAPLIIESPGGQAPQPNAISAAELKNQSQPITPHLSSLKSFSRAGDQPFAKPQRPPTSNDAASDGLSKVSPADNNQPHQGSIESAFNSSQSPVLTPSDKFKIVSDDTEKNMLRRLTQSPIQPLQSQQRLSRLIVQESAQPTEFQGKPISRKSDTFVPAAETHQTTTDRQTHKDPVTSFDLNNRATPPLTIQNHQVVQPDSPINVSQEFDAYRQEYQQHIPTTQHQHHCKTDEEHPTDESLLSGYDFGFKANKNKFKKNQQQSHK